MTVNAKERLAPLQSAQQERVREQSEAFRQKITDFCAAFKE